MEYSYKKAGMKDLDTLVKTRIKVLRAANRLDEDEDMTVVEKESRRYYEDALAGDKHTAYLVYDGEKVIGAGGISFYEVMPTFHNPTGKKAYIMNMYTDPEYRCRGVAGSMLKMLVQAARERGIFAISLEATDMGRPLYEAFGFRAMNSEMELPAQ